MSLVRCSHSENSGKGYEKMNITVLCVGKLKEKYWTDAIAEYSKRLSSYCTLKIEEVKEARLPDNAGPAEEEAVKEAEGKEMLMS